MNTKLYVGNLSYDVSENDLEDLFAQYGSVKEVNLLSDRMTGKSRGFGFVTMSSTDEANAATEALNGQEWEGRSLTVNEARPREEHTPFGGGGGGGNKGKRGNGRSKR